MRAAEEVDVGLGSFCKAVCVGTQVAACAAPMKMAEITGYHRCLFAVRQTFVEQAAVLSFNHFGLVESCNGDMLISGCHCSVDTFVVTAALILNDHERFNMDECVIKRNKDVVERHAEAVWSFF